MIEVEIKSRVPDIEIIEQKIINLGASLIGIEHHKDIYYNAPHRDFAETDEALRVRYKNNNIILTYKGKKLDKVSKSRREIKCKVDENIKEILSALGFRIVATVIKTRKKYGLDDFVIALDKVKSLGTFIEIEGIAKEGEFEATVSNAFKVLNKLGFGKENTIRESYLELLLQNTNNFTM
ncbi:MAG: class IV adenylate cyclase [Methanosarcinales archaeon]